MAHARPIRSWSPPILYPESDGTPMAETDEHYRLTTDLRFALEVFYKADPDVYVGADMFLYWEEGKPSSVVAPDVFVVQGRPKGERRTWKLWEEDGRVPALVIELTSESSRYHDLGTKKGVYEILGVSEYLVYDPLAEYLEPRFQAFRLVDGRYREPAGLPLRSVTTGLEFREHEGTLRLFDPSRGALLPTPMETDGRAWAEHERAESEYARAEAAEVRARATEVRARAAEGRAEEAARELERLRALLAAGEGVDEP